MRRKPDIAGTLDWAQVLRWRVHRQLLLQQTTNATKVAERLLGVHAQLANSATTAIRLRSTQRPPRTAKLVKTWAARGTLHLLPKDQLPMWMAVLSGNRLYEKPAWQKYHGVTAEGMRALLDAMPEALGEEPLTREELTDRLVEVTGMEDLRTLLSHSWGAGLKPAAYRGLLVFGPARGRNVTFVSPGPLPAVDPEEAMRALLRAYLATYGPVDADEYARWLGRAVAQVRKPFAALYDSGELIWMETGGKPRAMLAATRAGIEAATDAGVHLLPAFDPYVVGSLRQLPDIIDGGEVAQVSRPQGWISPVLVVDGRIAGTWQPGEPITPFRPLKPAAKRAVKAAAERLVEAGGDEKVAPAV